MIVALINSWACPAGKFWMAAFIFRNWASVCVGSLARQLLLRYEKRSGPARIGPYFGFNWLRLSE
jgi:hypothetical protein